MTGGRRPWMWSLPTRVELAEGAVIEFTEHGQPGIAFETSQIDKMFEIGLMQPPQTSARDPDSAVGVDLSGEARFLVGEVDLGRQAGMEVLVRGLEAAVDASYREYRERHPRAEAEDDRGQDPGVSEGTFDEPDLLGLSREITVPVKEAGDQVDDLLDEIEQGAHVLLVEDGRRVAVMMSWPAYVDLRGKLAGMAASFWSAWRTGVFDVARFATDVTRILHRRPRAQSNSSSDADEGRTAEGGEGDDQSR